MQSGGVRADGARYLVLGGGLACILRGLTMSPPVDESVVDRMGPWTPGPADRRDLQRQADRAKVVPLVRFHLDKDEHGYGSYARGEGPGPSPSENKAHASATNESEKAHLPTLLPEAHHKSFTAEPVDAERASGEQVLKFDTNVAYREGGKPNGAFTEARQALHEAVLDKQLAGKEKAEGKPIAIMMGGGPASGKSTMLGTMQDKLPPEKSTVHIDPDEMKQQLPEYQRLVKANDPIAAKFAHEESSHMAKELTARASEAGHNVVVDGTGDSSFTKLKDKVEKLQATGHEVHAHYATNDVELAMKLATIRARQSGRDVPEAAIRDTHMMVSRVLPEAVKNNLFDSVKLYDTNVRGEAKLVMSHTKGDKEPTIHDQKLWNDFLAKGHPDKGSTKLSTRYDMAADGDWVGLGDTAAVAGMIAEIDLGCPMDQSQYASLGPKYRAMWKQLAKEIAAIKAKGMTVDLPSGSWF